MKFNLVNMHGGVDNMTNMTYCNMKNMSQVPHILQFILQAVK